MQITAKTDILVIGHGIAGLSAAISAKEKNPGLDVLTVDKTDIGYAGKFNKGGGHVAFIPEGDHEKYVEYHTRNCGDYLNDQEMCRIYAMNTLKTINRWKSWGVKLTIDTDKAENAHPIIPWKMCLVDLDQMIPMAKHAKNLNVKSMSRISITDFITEGNRVTGAYGINLLTGEPVLFQAKAFVIANGNQSFKIMRMWSSASGDGIAAAYRAGAKLRNVEFGSFVNMIQMASKQVAYGSEDHLINADGKNISERAGLDEKLRNIVGGVDIGGSQSVLMYLDVRDGKGPIREDTEANKLYDSVIGRILFCAGKADPPFFRPWAWKFWDHLYNKNKANGWTHGKYANEGKLKEVVPGLIGELSPLYADHSMATSLEGLYGAGDIIANGLAWSGAVPTPPGRNRGFGIPHAIFTGITAGESAVAYAANHDYCNLTENQIGTVHQRLFNHLNKKDGLNSDDLVWKIQNLMQPVDYSGYKHEERMKKALEEVLRVKQDLGKLTAVDAHGLMKVNECKSIILCAELFFRTSLERKETRGWHIREDYKDRDDKNWLKWIFAQQGKNGEMEISHEPVPIEMYKYKPE
jgi:succinate dehydrogenase/fumarate reductase flavoprotein subunit